MVNSTGTTSPQRHNGATVDAAVEVDGDSPTKEAGVIAVPPPFLFLSFFLDEVLLFLLLVLATGTLGVLLSLSHSLEESDGVFSCVGQPRSWLIHFYYRM